MHLKKPNYTQVPLNYLSDVNNFQVAQKSD